MSLPLPFKNFIPRIYWEDPKSDALADKAQEHIEEWRDDVFGLSDLFDPAKCPSVFLDELAHFLAVDFLDDDDDTTKRQKVFDAVSSHKMRGLWAEDAKDKIDDYVGGDAQIFGSTDTDDWILPGDGTVPGTTYWAGLGGDGVATDYGIRLVGDGTAHVEKGVVLIDVDSSTLTADQVNELKSILSDSIPAYIRVFLGYVSAGDFVAYSNGQIH